MCQSSSALISAPRSAESCAPAAKSISGSSSRALPALCISRFSKISEIWAGISCKSAAKIEGRGARWSTASSAAEKTALPSFAGAISVASSTSGLPCPAASCIPFQISAPCCQRPRASETIVSISAGSRPAFFQKGLDRKRGPASAAMCQSSRPTWPTNSASSKVLPRSCRSKISTLGSSAGSRVSINGLIAERGMRPSSCSHFAVSINAPESGRKSRRIRLTSLGGRSRFSRCNDGPRMRKRISGLPSPSTTATILVRASSEATSN